MTQSGHREDHCRVSRAFDLRQCENVSPALFTYRFEAARIGRYAFLSANLSSPLSPMPLYQREATMAGIRLFHVHRTWEDYAGVTLGILIGLSPWLTGGQVKLLATGNAVAVGVMVLALAVFEWWI